MALVLVTEVGRKKSFDFELSLIQDGYQNVVVSEQVYGIKKRYFARKTRKQQKVENQTIKANDKMLFISTDAVEKCIDSIEKCTIH